MAAAITTTPIRWCGAATASCPSTSTCRAARPLPRRCSTASCSCRTRSSARIRSLDETELESNHLAMTPRLQRLFDSIKDLSPTERLGELTVEVAPSQYKSVCETLK